MIYLDYAATTPMSEKAIDVYTKAAREFFGNASSLHDIGNQSNRLLETARTELATLIHGEKNGIYFTSGGSEANDLAIRSLVKANNNKGKHLITTQGEHSSILNTFELLENEGYQVSYTPLNQYGEVLVSELEKLVTDKTILVSIGHASADIGTIQPLEVIGEVLAEKNILFHSDCVQTFGKIPVDVQKTKLTSISVSSHKIYGPKGIGASYISPEVSWRRVIPNVTHENGFRPGTVNIPAIAAFVTAASDIHHKMEQNQNKFLDLREQLLSCIMKKNQVILEGHPTNVLPHHVALRFPGIEGQYMMLECNRAGIAISTGSACQAGLDTPSKTLLATGKSEDEARELIRMTFGCDTMKRDIDTVIEVLQKTASSFHWNRRSSDFA
jgi:cysteine desulfurase